MSLLSLSLATIPPLLADSDAEFAEVREANALSYRNLVPGKVAISWNFPESVMETLAGRDRITGGSKNKREQRTGTNVYFAEHLTLPIQEWSKVELNDARKVDDQLKWCTVRLHVR